MSLNFKNKVDLIFLVQFFIVIFTVVFYPSTGFSWTSGLKEAAEAVAIGKASPEQKMLVFLKNKEVNLLAQEGIIRDYTYAACQDDFFRLNEKFVDQAVRNAGFEPSLSDRKYNPGTDTDVNINAKSDKKITLDDIKNIDNEYQKTVKQYFKDKGLNPPDGRVQTDTDFMPNPHQTTREEFQKCAEYVNKNGGTAYSDPQAASAQTKLGTTKQMSIDEALSFSATMKEMAEEKIKNADRLRKEASTIRSSNLDKAELLDAQTRQFDYQASKYYNRIGQLNNHLRQQYNLSSKLKAGYGFEKAVDNIDTIGRNPFSFKDAATIHSLHKDALQKYADDIINTLLEISKKEPAISAEITKAVSKEIKMMSNKDILFFFNCLCSDCGGSLGGGFNPEFKSDLGHGPCQCNGPLTIWKTPLPVNNKQLQYDCFNQVEKNAL